MRRRRQPDITFRDFRLFTFGSDEELIAAYGSLDNAEQNWRSIRDEFLWRWHLWGMPEAWWRFEPGIPEELRSGPPAILSNADAVKWEMIEQGRRQYLRSIGIDPTSSHRGNAASGPDGGRPDSRRS